MKKHTRHSAETIIAMRGEPKPPEVIARMKAAQSKRRTAERAALPKDEPLLFRHSIDRRLEIRSYRHSPETIAKMKTAQANRRAAEQEIKRMGVL